MTSLLFRVGTLALLIAPIAPANVSPRYARSEPRDQGRPKSRRADYCQTWDASPAANTSGQHRSTYCVTCERTPSGRIRRRSSARHAFRNLHPCPATGSTAGPCPGYVVDHVVPLKRGGTDSPENMQWQSSGKRKPKIESNRICLAGLISPPDTMGSVPTVRLSLLVSARGSPLCTLEEECIRSGRGRSLHRAESRRRLGPNNW